MKYQSSNTIIALRRRQRMNVIFLVLGVVLVLGVIYGFTVIGKNLFRGDNDKEQFERAIDNKVERIRIDRNAIPASRIDAIGYGKCFDDLNDIQLESAIKNGIKNPELIKDPTTQPGLVYIVTCDNYYVDEMTHSSPYLVPDAVLMLHYIAERFAEVLNERGRDNHEYKLVVTSALRTQNNINNLRRRNSNASENSCHRYGTTIDISYIRFVRDDGEIVNEEWLKRCLAEALYELRYEGICYVKHERRQACFHITLRNTNYYGDETSVTKQYASVGDITPIKKNHKKRTIKKLHKKQEQTQKSQSLTYVEY